MTADRWNAEGHPSMPSWSPAPLNHRPSPRPGPGRDRGRALREYPRPRSDGAGVEYGSRIWSPAIEESPRPASRRRPSPSRGGTTAPRWRRVPLVLRTTVAAALIAAVAVSVDRVDSSPLAALFRLVGPAGSGARTSLAVTPPAANPASGGGTAVSSAAAPRTGTRRPAVACRISSQILSSGAHEYTELITVTNTGATTINGWRLHWGFPAGQRVLYGWNAAVTVGRSGGTATDIGANRLLPPGAGTVLGFVGSRGRQVPAATRFTLNGVTCQRSSGQRPPPTGASAAR